jgi:hypothetical protein
MDMRATLAGAVSVLLLTGCGVDTAEPAPVEKTTEASSPTAKPTKAKPTTDTVGRAACEKFRILMTEGDVMTDAEIVAEIKTIYRDRGRYSDTDAIVESTRGLLDAVLNDGDITAATERLHLACERVGH